MSEKGGGEGLYTEGQVKGLLRSILKRVDMMIRSKKTRDPATQGQRKIPLPANTLGVHCDILWTLATDSNLPDEYKQALNAFHRAQVSPRLAAYAKDIFVVDDIIKDYLEDWQSEAVDLRIDPAERMKVLSMEDAVNDNDGEEE